MTTIDDHHGQRREVGLVRHLDSSVKKLACRLINNDRLRKPEFIRYKCKWLRDRELRFTEEYSEDARGMLETLRQRMELEENTVIPRLAGGRILRRA